MLVIMSPRYAQGFGIPPIHIALIRRDGFGRGAFIFAGSGGEGRQTLFTGHSEFLALLHILMQEPIALAVGGHCVGPADEVAMLNSSGELRGSYTEISWSGPDRWVLREMGENIFPWEQISDLRQLTNTSFNPDALTLNTLGAVKEPAE
jgi:hypothetical protein